jgi:hypothetical protein
MRRVFDRIKGLPGFEFGVGIALGITSGNITTYFTYMWRSGHTSIPDFAVMSLWSVGKGIVYGATYPLSVPLMVYDGIFSFAPHPTRNVVRHFYPMIKSERMRISYYSYDLINSNTLSYYGS